MSELGHLERLEIARDAVRYLTGRTDEELSRRVPNCPEWTVYNAVVHVCRSALGWSEWMRATPADPEAFDAGVRVREAEPSGVPMGTLAQWANGFIDQVDEDPTVVTFYPLGGGRGTAGLWALHAASEWGVHRLDVEGALGHDPSMTDQQALDALRWAVEIVLPVLAGRSSLELPALEAIVSTASGTRIGSVRRPDSFSGEPVTIEGPGVQVLLAVWGRPHTAVTVDKPAGLNIWTTVPSGQAQFGAWD